MSRTLVKNFDAPIHEFPMHKFTLQLPLNRMPLRSGRIMVTVHTIECYSRGVVSLNLARFA